MPKIQRVLRERDALSSLFNPITARGALKKTEAPGSSAQALSSPPPLFILGSTVRLKLAALRS